MLDKQTLAYKWGRRDLPMPISMEQEKAWTLERWAVLVTHAGIMKCLFMTSPREAEQSSPSWKVFFLFVWKPRNLNLVQHSWMRSYIQATVAGNQSWCNYLKWHRSDRQTNCSALWSLRLDWFNSHAVRLAPYLLMHTKAVISLGRGSVNFAWWLAVRLLNAIKFCLHVVQGTRKVCIDY